jgi:class 3 adenylate cyclase
MDRTSGNSGRPAPAATHWTAAGTAPAPVVDGGLALAVTGAITIAILVSPDRHANQSAVAYLLGGMLGVLLLGRRRWPLGVAAASAVILQLYYLLHYPGIFPAVPLSVALATAWIAGHRRWPLLIAVWFVVVQVLYRSLIAKAPVLPVLGDAIRDAALFAAVLLLGEAVRTRRLLDIAYGLLRAEQDKSERLLLNVLPAPIADRLKQTDDVIADAFSEVTVLFADIVDFTRRSELSAPEPVVQMLNQLFSAFDRTAQEHGLEKIKTIGDAYMLAGGLPTPRPDHAEAVADMALAMRHEVARHFYPSGQQLKLRIGIDTGPVVAGVIGKNKFSYDAWGDTVNTASRMQSSGPPDCIQVTARTWIRLRDNYRLERRGPISVKGKGEMITYLLLSRNE